MSFTRSFTPSLETGLTTSRKRSFSALEESLPRMQVSPEELCWSREDSPPIMELVHPIQAKVNPSWAPEFERNPWETFNTYQEVPGSSKHPKQDYVSATQVKNHLMKDPSLDWLKLYYRDLGLNSPEERDLKLKDPTAWIQLHQKRTHQLQQEMSHLQVLFQKGNQFEQQIQEDLKSRFPKDSVQIDEVMNRRAWDQWERRYAETVAQIKLGTPIILQGVLINESNKTFGISDLLVRSDWLSKLYQESHYDLEKDFPAPSLGTPYHYVVIDIKHSSLQLAADGEHLLNQKLFPAYKGQLLIYTAALGQIQGYTPEKAFIMGKSYQYSNQIKRKRYSYQGYNCYDRLGVINFADRDFDFLPRTQKAIHWVRRVRHAGNDWTFFPEPSVPELYPNMCNSNYDSPYHLVKKEISEKIKELTSIWNVQTKHRETAHRKGIYQYTDPRCTAKAMGIRGKKQAPIVDSILTMIREPTTGVKLIPPKIENNLGDWQTPSGLEFYVDFEACHTVFDDRHPIKLENSKSFGNVIFMVGVGHENSLGQWVYRSFWIPEVCLTSPSDIQSSEEKLLSQFQQYLEEQTNLYLEKHPEQRSAYRPRLFHWGHAEVSMLKAANQRHQNRFQGLLTQGQWLNMLTVFHEEPIIVRGAKKFGLKEVAKQMYQLGLIQTKWEESGPSSGLGAMRDAILYYNLRDQYRRGTEAQQKELAPSLEKMTARFANVIDYNEIDCKVVWEIVRYLRTHHCEVEEPEDTSVQSQSDSPLDSDWEL